MLWADLETALGEAPICYVEPRNKAEASELAGVKEFRRLFGKHFPHGRLVAIPNGGIRGQRALNQANAEGAAWGFPDLLVIGSVPFFPVIEWKSSTGAPKQHQVDWMNWLHRKGHKVALFRTPEAAIEWLFGIGFRA